MLRERINELEEIIAVMDGDREQMRAKIEEGAAKSKEQYAKIVNYSELLVTENRSLTQQVSVLTDLLHSKDQDLSHLKDQCTTQTAQLQSALTDLLAYQDLRLSLDRETRLRQTLEETVTQLNILLRTQE